MSNIVPMSDITTMAEIAAKSKMFGFKNAEEATAIMLLCQAENLHPAVAMRDYHVIQNRPALKADAMLARFQQAGGTVNWKTYTDTEVTGTFSHPQGGTLDVTWTFEQAKKIGITNKDNWKNYPRAMLRARCLSEGIRAVYPGVVVGVYTPEEVQDFTPPPATKDMGMAEVVDRDGVITVSITDPQPAAGTLPFYVPGDSKAFSSHATEEEWIEAYGKMVYRLTNSNKLSEEQKQEKLRDLGAANQEYISNMKGMAHARLKAAIVKAGGTVDPKSVLSQEPDEEVSDTPF